jgi:hypothetical protein
LIERGICLMTRDPYPFSILSVNQKDERERCCAYAS